VLVYVVLTYQLEESLSGGVQAMLFSDCGFLVYENALRATLAAVSLMRAFIRRGVPVRMGIGKRTFYDMEYTTTTPADQSRVVVPAIAANKYVNT